MWLHRENEYEWKYIGVWLDLLPEEFCTKVKGLISDYEVESIFLPFEQYPTVVDMVQDSLKVRNSIPAVIDVNDKKQNEAKNSRNLNIRRRYCRAGGDICAVVRRSALFGGRHDGGGYKRRFVYARVPAICAQVGGCMA